MSTAVERSFAARERPPGRHTAEGRDAIDDPSNPHFRTLPGEECASIRARSHVGRPAWAVGSRVEIKPVRCVLHDGGLCGRTSHGAHLQATAATWAPVAFEVDEMAEIFRWRSVAVHGGLCTTADDGVALHDEEWWHGVQLLRTLIPETFTGQDPIGFRMVPFRIAVQEVTGREAVPGEAPALVAEVRRSGDMGTRGDGVQQFTTLDLDHMVNKCYAVIARMVNKGRGSAGRSGRKGLPGPRQRELPGR